MGDDFDLFPKREHLDPFSFDSKEEEKESSDTGDQEDHVVFDDDSASGNAILPETPSVEDEEMPRPSIDGPEFELPSDFFGAEPPDDFQSSAPDIFDEPQESAPGPIPDDEPESVKLEGPPPKARGAKPERKGPSAFVLVGGAILVILVVLWGALNYLKKESRPAAVLPPIQRKAQIPATEPVSLQPSVVEKDAPSQTPAAESKEVSQDVSVASQKTGEQTATKGSSAQVPETPAAAPKKPAAGLAPSRAEKTDQQSSSSILDASSYSVQVGALILRSSVKELEKKLSGTGYEPFYKKGTTHTSMNFLTVGPFATGEGTKALDRIRKAGLEANIRHFSAGDIINAGGYLLSGNARRVSNRIRALGYPVKLERKETQMPITLVRVGRYSTKTEATRLRDELKKKGFDAIVVKLQ